MPEKLMRGNAPSKSINQPSSSQEGLRQPMALDGTRLNEKKGKKVKATYSSVSSNYEAIRSPTRRGPPWRRCLVVRKKLASAFRDLVIRYQAN